MVDPQVLRNAQRLGRHSPDALADVAERTAASVLYAAGPVELSTQVAAVAARLGRISQVTALDVGADSVCGHGLCGSCDLPLAARGASAVRPCTEGPVLPSFSTSGVGEGLGVMTGGLVGICVTGPSGLVVIGAKLGTPKPGELKG